MKYFRFVASVLVYFLFYLALAIPFGLFSSAPFVFTSESMYVIDKVVLYLSIYCLPYVLSYFALSKVLKKLSFEWPSLVVYLAHSSSLFFNDTYWARGMQVDSKILYFCLLYVPPLVVLSFLLKQKKTIKASRQASFAMSLIGARGWARPLVLTASLLSLMALGASCFVREHPPIQSPSGEYKIFAAIEGVSLIHLHLTNKEGVELDTVYSGASNAMKWALGWMPDEDIVVLQSSDIGPRAYDIENNRLVAKSYPFKDKHIQARAEELKSEKYGNSHEMGVSITYDSDEEIVDTCDNDDPKVECVTRPAQPD
jgi:hypothetical protein